jgi:hypothetical protein
MTLDKRSSLSACSLDVTTPAAGKGSRPGSCKFEIGQPVVPNHPLMPDSWHQLSQSSRTGKALARVVRHKEEFADSQACSVLKRAWINRYDAYIGGSVGVKQALDEARR